MTNIESKEQIASQLVRLKLYSRSLLENLGRLNQAQAGMDTSEEHTLALSRNETYERLSQTGECIIYFLLRYEQAGATAHDLSQILGVNENVTNNLIRTEAVRASHKTDFPSLVYVHRIESECRSSSDRLRVPFLSAMESYLKRKALVSTLTYGVELERRRRKRHREAACH